MSNLDHVTDLLPFYAAATLDDRQHRSVDDHLRTCSACRAELRFWMTVGETVVVAEAGLPQPSARILDGALSTLGASRTGVLIHAWQLLRAQLSLLRHEIWLSSALVMGLGYIMAIVAGGDGRSGGIITVIAPLIAAAGVAMIYGPENDPALELALSTPTSPWQVLIARLFLVFGYDLLLALLATAGLIAVVPVDLLGSIVLDWLGPMTFLSALTLVLSLRVGTNGAVTVALLAWLARWMARGIGHGGSFAVDLGAPVVSLARGYEGAWANPSLLLGLGGLMILAALLVVGRYESILRPRSVRG